MSVPVTVSVEVYPTAWVSVETLLLMTSVVVVPSELVAVIFVSPFLA